MSDQDAFRQELGKLVASAAKRVGDDADFGASVIIEGLSAELGAVIGFFSGGDSKVIDTLMTGTEAYIHKSAVHTANMCGFIEKSRARK